MSIERNNHYDFHCHYAMKPYCKNYNYSTIGKNKPGRSRPTSIRIYNILTLPYKVNKLCSVNNKIELLL